MNKAKASYATVATLCCVVVIAIIIGILWFIGTNFSGEALVATIGVIIGGFCLAGVWKSFYDSY